MPRATAALGWLSLGWLSLAGCSGGHDPSGTTAPPAQATDATPAVPTIEITTDDPEILAQVAQARAALTAAPEDAVANGRMGNLYELYQRPAAALDCYLRAAHFAPDVFRWRYHLARVQHALGENDEALGSLERALAIDPRYVPALALRGDVLLENGDDAAAEQAYRAVLAVFPRSCSGNLGLGRVLAARGDHAAAMPWYMKALEVAPAHAPLHQAAGMSRRALGETEMARKHLERAAECGEANPDPDPELAKLFDLEVGSERDYREAKRFLNARDFEPAIALLRKVVEKDPGRVEALGALGKALMLSGHDSEALVVYEQAVAKNPTNIDFLRPYGAELGVAGRLEEAEAALRKVFDLGGGKHPDDHHVLGLILFQQGRFSEAAACFESALALAPDHAQAKGMLQRARAGR